MTPEQTAAVERAKSVIANAEATLAAPRATGPAWEPAPAAPQAKHDQSGSDLVRWSGIDRLMEKMGQTIGHLIRTERKRIDAMEARLEAIEARQKEAHS